MFVGWSGNELPQTLKTGIFSLFGMSNIFLFRTHSDYFSGEVEFNFFTHTWSLGVEEQFYLLFPFLLVFSGYVGKECLKNTRKFNVTIGSLSVLSLAAFLLVRSREPMASFYLMPMRFWELGLGVLAFSYDSEGRRKIKNRRLSQLLSAIVIMAMLIVISRPNLSNSLGPLWISLLTVCLIKVLPGTLAESFFSSSPMTFVGKRSYSIYLWHWPILTLARYLASPEIHDLGLYLLVTLCVACISYHYIESPVRNNSGKGQISRKSVFGFAVGATGLVFVMLFALGSLPLRGKIFVGNSAYRSLDQGLVWLIQNCNRSTAAEVDNNFFARCGLNSENHKRRLILAGDSHAARLIEPFSIVAKRLGYEFGFLTASGEAFPAFSGSSESIARSEKITSQIVSTSNRDDVVVISGNLDENFFGLRQASATQSPDLNGLKTYIKNIQDFASRLEIKGAGLVIVGSKPFFPDIKVGQLCQPEWFRSNRLTAADACFVYKNIQLFQRRALVDALDNLREQNSNLAILNLIDLICPTERCTVAGEMGPKFDDSNHISYQMANSLAEPLFLWLKEKQPSFTAKQSSPIVTKGGG